MLDIPTSLGIAIRRCRRHSWASLTSISTLAAATGALGVMLAATYRTALLPLPYPRSSQIVTIEQRGDLLSDEDVRLASEAQAVSGLGSVATGRLDFRHADESGTLNVAAIDSQFMSVLGLPAAVGRSLTRGDFEVDSPAAVVVSHAFAFRSGGDAGVIGTSIYIDGRYFTIVGVMPATFDFPTGTDVWGPRSKVSALADSKALIAIGRLASSGSVPRLQRELDLLGKRREGPTLTGLPFRYRVLNFSTLARHRTAPAFWLLATSVVLLFVVTVGTLLSLALVRASTRTQEVALHLALGASGRQLVFQQMEEDGLLSATGVLIGILIAIGVTRALASRPLRAGVWPSDVSVSWPVVCVVLVVGALVSLLVAVVPLLQFHRLQLHDTLRKGSAGLTATAANRKLRAGLVAVELALVMFLAIATGVLLKEGSRLSHVDWGYDASHIVIGFVHLPTSAFPSPAVRSDAADQVVGRLRGQHGIASATVFGETWLLQNLRRGHAGIELDSHGNEGRGEPVLPFESIDADSGYFSTMGVRIVRGRGIRASDDASAPPVVVIDEQLADADWPNEDPLGHRIRFPAAEPGGPWYTVIGVAQSAGYFGPIPAIRAPERSWHPVIVYRSRLQVPLAVRPDESGPAGPGFAVAVRAVSNYDGEAGAVRHAIAEVFPDLPLKHLGTLEAYFQETAGASQLRNTTRLLIMFAGFGGVLCLLGILGIVTDAVVRRTREIGIRVALGARPSDVIAIALHESTWTAAAGILLGLLVSLLLSRLIGHFIFMRDITSGDPYAGSLSIGDPIIVLGAAMVTFVLALGASLWPARRALAIPPSTALRSE